MCCLLSFPCHLRSLRLTVKESNTKVPRTKRTNFSYFTRVIELQFREVSSYLQSLPSTIKTKNMGGDAKLLDTNQVINGLAVLLSFFVGYKYAIKKHITEAGDEKGASKDESSTTGAMGFSDFSDNYKMVLVVRNDLKMGKGKIGSQCGHGAVGAYQKSMRHKPNLVRLWEQTGCAKIALKVESERELQTIRRAAEANGLICCVIHDAGRTQIEPNSKTVLAIGPAAASDIDKVTGHLKLL